MSLIVNKAKPITCIQDYLDEDWNPVPSSKEACWIHKILFDKNGRVSRCIHQKTLRSKCVEFGSKISKI